MPKGGASSLLPVCSGIKEDLNWFLKSFLSIKSRRFVDYKNLFIQRKIINIFNGRHEKSEIIEFNEHLLISCMSFMDENVAPGVPRRIEERLFGLYSLYMFFYTQAADHVVKVRIDPDLGRNFQKFTYFLRDQKIYDAYKICLKLVEDEAFKYVAFIHTYDPTLFRQLSPVLNCPTYANVNDPLGRSEMLFESPLFAYLGLIHKEYTLLKENAGINFGSDLCDIQESLQGTLEKHRDGENQTDAVLKSFHSVSQENSRSVIKERAYQDTTKYNRFRRTRKYKLDMKDVEIPPKSAKMKIEIPVERKPILDKIDKAYNPPKKMKFEIKKEAIESVESLSLETGFLE